MNFFWHYAVARTPDGWLVLFATNGNQTDEEILAQGIENAPIRHADPATVRVVHSETATAEERDMFDNFMELMYLVVTHQLPYGYDKPDEQRADGGPGRANGMSDAGGDEG
ncbi:MAG TPA: hypothetical protein VGN32_10290 [Ktedonobacterales bacterium]|nr:hypothetical protein [Ktedonobacterales bacterium]